MDPFDQVDRIEQVGLACARRAAAYIDTCHGASTAEDHRATGQRFIILRMAHLDPAHIGDGVP